MLQIPVGNVGSWHQTDAGFVRHLIHWFRQQKDAFTYSRFIHSFSWEPRRDWGPDHGQQRPLFKPSWGLLLHVILPSLSLSLCSLPVISLLLAL